METLDIKSIRLICESFDIAFIEIRCDMIDLYGLEAFKTSTDHKAYKDLADLDKKCVLAFNSYHRCTTDIKKVVDEIIETKMLGELELKENVVILH
jgi:hypothetical protein